MSELPNNCGEWRSIDESKAGRWMWKIKTDEHGFYWWRECSECGSKPLLNMWNREEELSNFCPSCGARMEDGGEE